LKINLDLSSQEVKSFVTWNSLTVNADDPTVKLSPNSQGL